MSWVYGRAGWREVWWGKEEREVVDEVGWEERRVVMSDREERESGVRCCVCSAR